MKKAVYLKIPTPDTLLDITGFFIDRLLSGDSQVEEIQIMRSLLEKNEDRRWTAFC